VSFFRKISEIFSDSIGDEDCFLAFDVGTTSVQAAVFKIVKQLSENGVGPRAVILGAGRSLLDAREAEKKDFENLVDACLEAKKEAENMAGVRAKKTVIGFAGQFVKGSSGIEVLQRDDQERPIDLAEIKNSVQKAQWKIFESIRKNETSETGIPETAIRLINGRVMDSKVDGYRVSNPIGFQGKELSLNIFNSFAHSFLSGFLKRFSDSLDIEIISLECQPHAVAVAVAERVFRESGIANISCFLIDCGGRSTDISYFHQGVFRGPKIFSVGGAAITRRLAREFNLSFGESEKLKIKYSNRQVSPQIKRKITNLINTDVGIWGSGVADAVRDFGRGESLPHLILLTGGGSLFPGIRKILENSEWQQNAGFIQTAKVRQLDIGDFINVEDKTNLLPKVTNAALPALVSAGTGLAKKESLLDSVLNRVIRLMSK
jgi:cell division protein FtsA